MFDYVVLAGPVTVPAGARFRPALDIAGRYRHALEPGKDRLRQPVSVKTGYRFGCDLDLTGTCGRALALADQPEVSLVERRLRKPKAVSAIKRVVAAVEKRVKRKYKRRKPVKARARKPVEEAGAPPPV